MLGFYDSGIGGVTILNEFVKTNPGKKCIYFADTANCPLGEKSEKEILEIVKNRVEFLFNKGCNLVVLACNTATAIAVRYLQQEFIPKNYPYKNVLGIVQPVMEELKKNSPLLAKGWQTKSDGVVFTQKNQRDSSASVEMTIEPILLLATPATCSSKFYDNELKEEGFSDFECVGLEGLAGAVESEDNDLIDQILDNKLGEIKRKDFRTVALVCTHFPIVENKIKSKLVELGFDEDLRIISQDKMVADKLVEYLEKHPEYEIENGGVEFVVSGDEVVFENNLKKVFGIECVVVKM